MSRSHWFTSPDPPKFGEDLVAVCGEVVPKAQPGVWEGGGVRCGDCNELDTDFVSKVYLAVIQSGEESIER